MSLPTSDIRHPTSDISKRWPSIRLCGRKILHPLPGGRSIIAQDLDPTRTVVMKRLPPDCMDSGGDLHPHVHDRLARIQQLPDLAIASLHGIELDEAAGPILIWDYIPGQNLSEALSVPDHPLAEDLLHLALTLTTTLERLHLLGIVHGALHLRNIIVTGEGGPDNSITLTHLSPLVHDDPRRDTAALLRILRELNARPAPGTMPLSASRSSPSSTTRPTTGSSAGPGGVSSALLAKILADTTPETSLSDLRESLLLAEGARFIPAPPPPTPTASAANALALTAIAFAISTTLALYLFNQ